MVLCLVRDVSIYFVPMTDSAAYSALDSFTHIRHTTVVSLTLLQFFMLPKNHYTVPFYMITEKDSLKFVVSCFAVIKPGRPAPNPKVFYLLLQHAGCRRLYTHYLHTKTVRWSLDLSLSRFKNGVYR